MSDRPTPAALRIALGFAMIAAAVQMVRSEYLQHVRGTFSWASRDAFWMAPTAFLGLYAAALGVLFLASLVHGALRQPSNVAGVMGGLTVYSVVSHFNQIHPAAWLLVALGAGVRIGAAVKRAPDPWIHRLGRIGAALTVVIGGLAVGERLWRSSHETLVLEGAPVADPGAPNVLLIILDTVRRSNLSLYGYERSTTPNIDRLARDGIVFDWAIAPSSWTLPSHAAMFTGHRPGTLGVGWREPFEAAVPTLAEALLERGYATGGFVGNLYYTTHESGLARGFGRFRDYRRSVQQVLLSANLVQLPLVRRLLSARGIDAVIAILRDFDLAEDLRMPAEPSHHPRRSQVIAQEFLAWQEGIANRPFFAFLNLFGAHDPFRIPASWRTRFAASPSSVDLYDAAIAREDSIVGLIIDTLRSRGVLDRTVVVITSDHGEHLGARGLNGHGISLYLPELRVPLVLRYPGRVPADAWVDTPVSLTALPATIMSLVAGTSDGAHPFPGRSWLAVDDAPPSPVLSELEQSDNPEVPAGEAPLYSLITDRYHYIYSETGKEELYEVERDPGETRNLAGRPEFQAVVTALRRDLVALVPTVTHRVPTP